MKKEITRTINYCDFCGKQDAYKSCNSCMKDICYECEDTYLENLPYSVFSSSHEKQLSYCKECFKQYPGIKNLDIVKLSLQIRSLRLEHDGFYLDFKNRMTKLEDKMRGFLK